MKLPRDWDALAADHSAAIQQFAMTVVQLPPDSWGRPLAPGKWSPAEVTSHLAESYRILRIELAGGQGMALRLPRFQCWLLRHTILPRILRTGLFPTGARAPREIRPREVMKDPSAALEVLTAEANAFMEDLTTRASSRRVHLTHAYFGSMSARQSLQMVAVHTRHHAHQLAGVQT
jgi:DinB superfamily